MPTSIIDALSVVNNASIGGTLGVTGNFTGAANVTWGVYTPTYTAITANVTGTTHHAGTYMRLGGIVIVGVEATIVVNATTGLVQVQFTLPIASAFATTGDATGSGSAYVSTGNLSCVLGANVANDRIQIAFSSPGAASYRFGTLSIYRIL